MFFNFVRKLIKSALKLTRSPTVSWTLLAIHYLLRYLFTQKEGLST